MVLVGDVDYCSLYLLFSLCLTPLLFFRWLFCICQWSGNYLFDFSSVLPMAVQILPVVWQRLVVKSSLLPLLFRQFFVEFKEVGDGVGLGGGDR